MAVDDISKVMTEILFYHLERARLQGVLPGLLEKTLAKGWKAVVRAGSREHVEALDGLLWTYRDEAFLPHGVEAADDPAAARQPVWLTAQSDDGPNMSNAPNGADVLFLVEGAAAAVDMLGSFARCVMIFDGHDEAAVAEARAFWKAVKEAGHDATYWKQSGDGRFEKQG